MPKPHIVVVVEGFADWSRPWSFLDAVLRHGSLSKADQIVVRIIWENVCSSTHWEGFNSVTGSNAADQALQSSFTWLSDIARSHFVRAAAYEWQ
jgi:hypothetical protein